LELDNWIYGSLALKLRENCQMVQGRGALVYAVSQRFGIDATNRTATLRNLNNVQRFKRIYNCSDYLNLQTGVKV